MLISQMTWSATSISNLVTTVVCLLEISSLLGFRRWTEAREMSFSRYLDF